MDKSREHLLRPYQSKLRDKLEIGNPEIVGHHREYMKKKLQNSQFTIAIVLIFARFFEVKKNLTMKDDELQTIREYFEISGSLTFEKML